MIECRPYGICSWSFDLQGEGHQARTDLGFGEQGRLWVDDKEYVIHKEGTFSGRWRMDSPLHPVFHAQKESAFQRTIAIRGDGRSALLRADALFGRTMVLDTATTRCTIEPMHPFTRRALIQGGMPEDFRLTAFAFWLTAVLWRRGRRLKGRLPFRERSRARPASPEGPCPGWHRAARCESRRS